MSYEREFVNQLEEIRDFWAKESGTKEEVADRIIYSILALFDGSIDINNYHKLGIIDYTEGKVISGGKLLDIYKGAIA